MRAARTACSSEMVVGNILTSAPSGISSPACASIRVTMASAPDRSTVKFQYPAKAALLGNAIIYVVTLTEVGVSHHAVICPFKPSVKGS